MTRFSVRGHTPWQRSESASEEPKETHPRREITYHCEHGCIRSPFTVTLAAEAIPRDTWDCPGGHVALREGAPEDTPREVNLPGQANPGALKTRHAAETTPQAQLLKRRTVAELEAILAERMAEVGQSGVAR